MELRLKDNEYFEIYFNNDKAQIVYGYLYYDIYHEFSQIYKDSFETNSLKILLKRIDSRCGKFVKEIKDYMNAHKYYFSIYRLNRDDVTYYIKEQHSNKKIATAGSLYELIDNIILTENKTESL